MINHARTLLLNRSGRNQSLRELGEEYIPEDFQAASLPVWIRAYWEVLFGSSPENTYRNYVVGRLLRIIHATDYAGYLLYLDRRITYEPDVAGPFARVPYEFIWSRRAGGSANKGVIQSVDRLGDLVADEKTGVMKDSWNVDMDNGEATITNVRTHEQRVVDAFAGEHISKSLPLPNNGMRFTVRYDDVVRASWDVDFRVDVFLEPRMDLSEKIAALEQLRSHTFELFGRSASEPYLTFFGLWQQDVLPDKLTGLLLAMIYRMHDIWAAARSDVASTLSGHDNGD